MKIILAHVFVGIVVAGAIGWFLWNHGPEGVFILVFVPTFFLIAKSLEVIALHWGWFDAD
jgi:hypothetical protein